MYTVTVAGTCPLCPDQARPMENQNSWPESDFKIPPHPSPVFLTLLAAPHFTRSQLDDRRRRLLIRRVKVIEVKPPGLQGLGRDQPGNVGMVVVPA